MLLLLVYCMLKVVIKNEILCYSWQLFMLPIDVQRSKSYIINMSVDTFYHDIVLFQKTEFSVVEIA